MTPKIHEDRRSVVPEAWLYHKEQTRPLKLEPAEQFEMLQSVEPNSGKCESQKMDARDRKLTSDRKPHPDIDEGSKRNSEEAERWSPEDYSPITPPRDSQETRATRNKEFARSARLHAKEIRKASDARS